MRGNLQHMAVADLIQHNCQDRKIAQLAIEHNGHQATIFFKEGSVVHATLDDIQGEEVIYQILSWQDGDFNLDMGVEPPTVTINRSWSGLLLEGARRLDEAKHSTTITSSLLFTQEVKLMATKKKSEQLADALTELIQGSADIEGAAIVGTDGLVYSANVPQRALDENMVGATSAAILGLSKRSVSQLKRGNFSQTLIQGEDGNIVVAGLDDQTLLVGLTAKNVNLGMAFAEVRTMASRLREIL